MDLVVSRIRVLQDNYIETAPSALQDFYLGPQVPGIPLTRQKNSVVKVVEESDTSDDMMDYIYDRVDDNDKEKKILDRERDEGMSMNRRDNGVDNGANIVSITDGADDKMETDADEPPTLTMENINSPAHEFPSSPSSSSSSASMRGRNSSLPVTVVDSLSTITDFATAVRQLSLEASSTPSDAPINSKSVLLYLPFTQYARFPIPLTLSLSAPHSLSISLVHVTLSLSQSFSLSTYHTICDLDCTLLLTDAFILATILPTPFYLTNSSYFLDFTHSLYPSILFTSPET
jgi:hypothetical protein